MIAEIQACVREAFADARIEVTEQGGHYTILVVDPMMQGLSPVKRQQAVYAPLSEMISDGRLHAVNIRAHTPEEYAAQN